MFSSLKGGEGINFTLTSFLNNMKAGLTNGAAIVPHHFYLN